MTVVIVPPATAQVKKTGDIFDFDFAAAQGIVGPSPGRCLVSSDLFLFEERDEILRLILLHYTDAGIRRIAPRDSETRLFLTDIPVIDRPRDAFDDRTVHLLRDGRLLVRSVADETQATVHRDIARFSLFVHFFGEMLAMKRAGTLPVAGKDRVRELLAALPPMRTAPPPMPNGPFADEPAARRAVVEAGNALVAAGLVDSIFGNISYRLGDTLLISRSGAPLDALEQGLVACPLSEECGKGRRASTEYPSHRLIALQGRYRALLHGHPRWTVIATLADPASTLCGLPVVEGEPGDGLARVLPAVVMAHGAAVVRGHGLFAAGIEDFRDPFDAICRVEAHAFERCRDQLV